MPDNPRMINGIMCRMTKQLLWYLMSQYNGWPKTAPYYEEIRDRHKGATALVVCPGPSLSNFKPEMFDGKLTLAVNSAMWWLHKPRYISVAEGVFGWWIDQFNAEWKKQYLRGLEEQEFLMSCRAAATWLKFGLPHKHLYVTRHEEDAWMPVTHEGATICYTLCSAMWLGCSKAIIFGMDLAKDPSPYVEGVPCQRNAIVRDYGPQIRSLRLLRLGDMQVLNASPISSKFKRFPFKAISVEDAIKELEGIPRL